MKIVNFSTRDTAPRAGFLVGTSVLPADAVLGGAATIPEVLAAGDDIRQRVAQAAGGDDVPRLPRGEVRLHAPVQPGALILCAGGNYRSHLEEMRDSVPRKAPSFVKSPNAVIGPDDPVILPSAFPEMIDYEGELCAVFGRECHGVSAEDAMDYVAGYTILNDVSARDKVQAMITASTPTDGRWSVIEMLLGKQFPTFAPVGPAILTADEVPDPGKLRLTTRLNGTVMQDAYLADLVVGIPQLIEEFSRYYSFAPGDLLSTGTPAGTGAGQNPPRYLKVGDEVAIEVTGIGTLSNRVVPATVPVAR